MINIKEGNRITFEPLLTKDNNIVTIVDKFRQRIRQEKYDLVNYILLVDGCPFLQNSIICQESTSQEVLLYISKMNDNQKQIKHKNFFLLLPHNNSYHYSLIASLWLLCKILISEIQSIIDVFYPLFDDEQIQESIQDTSPNSIFMIDTEAENPEIEFYNKSDEETKIQINTFFPLKEFKHYPDEYTKQIDMLTEVTNQHSSKFSNQLDMFKSLLFFQMICQEINQNRVIELPIFFNSLEEKVLKEIVNKSTKFLQTEKSSINQQCNYPKALEIKRVIYNNIFKDILNTNDEIQEIPTFPNISLEHHYQDGRFQDREKFQKFQREFFESVRRINQYKPTESNKSYKEKLSTAIQNNFKDSQVQQPKCRFSEVMCMDPNLSKINKKQEENNTSAFKGVPTNVFNIEKINSAQNLLPSPLTQNQSNPKQVIKEIKVNSDKKSNQKQSQPQLDCCKCISDKTCHLF